STDYALLMTELVRNPEQYDNPVCVEAVANALKESDTSHGAKPVWVPPSANGLFGGLPPRIRKLAQELFASEGPSGVELPSVAPPSVAPSTNGKSRSPKHPAGD